MQPRLRYGLMVLGVIVFIIFISKIPSYGLTGGDDREMSQWSQLLDETQKLLFLAKQDQNPLVSLLHSTAAMSKLHTLRSMGPLNRISKRLDIDLGELSAELIETQRVKSRLINETCPGLFIMTSGAYDVDLFA